MQGRYFLITGMLITGFYCNWECASRLGCRNSLHSAGSPGNTLRISASHKAQSFIRSTTQTPVSKSTGDRHSRTRYPCTRTALALLFPVHCVRLLRLLQLHNTRTSAPVLPTNPDQRHRLQAQAFQPRLPNPSTTLTLSILSLLRSPCKTASPATQITRHPAHMSTSPTATNVITLAPTHSHPI